GHILLEGVPGLAKTLLIRTLSECMNASFSRIQFTPDMLPVDVIGTEIFNPKDASFSVKKGPVFGNLVLADEINRAPAKVQSALLEAMQEKQVTIGRETFKLDAPFLVMATQNPIEQEGTYPLPEAQLDRFMLKVLVGYLNRDDEIKVVERMAGGTPLPQIRQVMTLEDVLAAKKAAETILTEKKVLGYAVDLVETTRYPMEHGLSIASLIEMGASPRASINLVKAAKVHALLNGRDFCKPQDIKSIAPDVLRHRIALSYEAEAQGKTADDIINVILDACPVP
ncbi:MAG: AAA family ATPase, partial [Proteobacteria bacterium]|nr:AAA family ATPase [Pseudomonadota bacterium]